MRRLTIPTLLLVLLTCVGCSDRAYVQGQVIRTDGTPVVKARVVARSDETGVSGHGLTNDSGNYSLGVMEKGDGLPPGKYTVVVVEDLGDVTNPKPPTVHPNYRHPTTSGLSLTLEPREKRAYDLELKLPPGRSN